VNAKTIMDRFPDEPTTVTWVRQHAQLAVAFSDKPARCPLCGFPLAVPIHFIGRCGTGVAKA
jgi:hypothetical protein